MLKMRLVSGTSLSYARWKSVSPMIVDPKVMTVGGFVRTLLSTAAYAAKLAIAPPKLWPAIMKRRLELAVRLWIAL